MDRRIEELEERVRGLGQELASLKIGAEPVPAVWHVQDDNGDDTFDLRRMYTDATEGTTVTLQSQIEAGDGTDAQEDDLVMLVRLANGKRRFVRLFCPSLIAGYDNAKTQVLTHVSGVLTWWDTGPC